jgi:hypothetical protein
VRALRRLPSPPVVLASLALLVALGGTGVAAVAISLPRASVGTLQLKNGAVVSSKVKDGSLLRRDFKPGQILAGPAGPAGPPGRTGATGLTGPTGPAGPVTGVKPGDVVDVGTSASSSAQEIIDTTFTGHPPIASGAAIVPEGQTAWLVILFSAETACDGGTVPARCQLQITVDGGYPKPTYADFVSWGDNGFRNVKGGAGGYVVDEGAYSTRAVVRWIRVGPGAHDVVVTARVSNAATFFEIHHWSLVVERIRIT